jgi:Xaa-Pro dipeptidase
MSTLASLYDSHLSVLRARIDAALGDSGFDSLAIYAGQPPMQFLDDNPYPFKVNPHFKAWVPLLDAAECWIAYEPGRQPRLVFLQPNDYWHKPPALPDGYWTRHFAIEVIREPAQAKAYVAQLPRCAVIGELPTEFTDWGFEATNPPELIERLHYTRAIKTPYELQCLRLASERGARGHKAAEAAFRAGASEYGIHMAYIAATGHTETALPYSNIVALNTNAAVLHYQHQESTPPAQLRSFLIDAGAQFAGYACDITRTYSHAHDEFESLIEGMHRLQQKLCAEVRAGVDYADIHLNAHRYIAELLRDSGVIALNADAAVASGLSGIFFPHGVGHLLGLQVHDVSGFSISPDGKRKARPAGHPYLRLTRTLEPGFVVTIEPGLYFIDALLDAARQSAHAAHINWQQVDRFRPYGGIRIEDDVVCTTGEPENLTRRAEKEANRPTGHG